MLLAEVEGGGPLPGEEQFAGRNAAVSLPKVGVKGKGGAHDDVVAGTHEGAYEIEVLRAEFGDVGKA